LGWQVSTRTHVLLVQMSQIRPSKAPELLRQVASPAKREFFIDNLLVRIHFIIVMIRWTGLAPREFEFPFPGSLTSTFLDSPANVDLRGLQLLTYAARNF